MVVDFESAVEVDRKWLLPTVKEAAEAVTYDAHMMHRNRWNAESCCLCVCVWGGGVLCLGETDLQVFTE